MNQKSKNWWESLVTIEGPFPHIPRKEIMAAMPKELHEAFGDFMMGQTCLRMDNGDSGIYPWDFERFVYKYKNNQPLVDTAAEWD